jgi:hypothetical protein
MKLGYAVHARLALALLVLLLPALPAAAAQCTVTQKDLDGNGTLDLRIVGSLIPQKVIIDAYQDQTVVSLDCNGDGSFNGSPATGDMNQKVLPAFGLYEIRLKGKDTVTFNVADAWSGQPRALQVAAGGGTNRLTLGGSGALLAGSRLTVDVLGGAGHERLSLTLPTMDASSLLLKADLNVGVNGVSIAAPNPITGGSVAALTAVLDGRGNDFDFSHSSLLEGTLDVNVDGSVFADAATASFAGQVDGAGRLRLQAGLLQGPDTFVATVDLGTLSVAAGGELHVFVNGGPGVDRISFGPGGSVGGATVLAGLLDVALKGGEGDDTIALNFGAGGFAVDGTLRLRLDGESGADALNGTVDVAAGSTTPELDVAFHGGHGADRLSLTINDDGPGGAASYGTAGRAFLDGGAASDACNAAGTGLIHERNCES